MEHAKKTYKHARNLWAVAILAVMISVAVFTAMTFSMLGCGGGRLSNMPPPDSRQYGAEYAPPISNEMAVAESEQLSGQPMRQPMASYAPAPAAPAMVPAGGMPDGRVHGIADELGNLMADGSPIGRRQTAPWNTEQYDRIIEQPFRIAAQEPLSTFSVDVDTASYSNVRRFLFMGQAPPPDAVRIEELINYFEYDYPNPAGDERVGIAAEVAMAPWNPGHRLVRIGLRAKTRERGHVPPRNLVFLIDVSGSMSDHNKLPLLKQAFELLTEQLRAEDTVSMVVYAGASGVVLPPTSGDRRGEISRALDRLQAGGSTHGAAGIELAYRLASERHRRGTNSRVILATDGDFNVGISDRGSLTRLIEEKRRSGVHLTVLGFGMGNLKDATMESLADTGDGNYAYIDTIREAKKVLVHELGATLHMAAKDTKVQVEFNPARVSRYRLIGYENRRLEHADFNNDRKDAGDMGEGHTVTVLYEVVLHSQSDESSSGSAPRIDPLKYQTRRELAPIADSGELLTVKVRYKEPEQSHSRLLSLAVEDRGRDFEAASTDFRFAAAVAGFGMLLRGSRHRGDMDLERVRTVAAGALGRDAYGYRSEFVELVDRASSAIR